MPRDFFVHVSIYLFLTTLVGGVLVVSRGQVIATNTVESLPYVYQIAEYDPLPEIGGYVVIDAKTGEVLLAQAADELRPTASVIKLTVAAAAFLSPWLDATTTISASDVAAPEDFGKLVVGETYSLRELLFPYLLESSNDAGAAIERTWGEALRPQIDELVATADVTGAIVVSDFNGLDADTKASPHALARLAGQVARVAPTILDITTLPEYLGQHPLVNNSPLIAESAYRGGKHGYTPEAGKAAIVRFRSSFQDGEQTLIAVMLDARDTKAAFSALAKQIEEAVTRVPQTETESGILPDVI